MKEVESSNIMRCKHCDFWREAEGTTREEDIGGCTYLPKGFYPMFLNENCAIKEPYRTEVLIHHKL